MRNVIEIVFTSAKEAGKRFMSWIHNNLKVFANVLSVMCPYVTALAVLNAYNKCGQLTIGFEWFIPLVFWIVIWMLRTIANKTGKGITIPKPVKRFTEVSEDGEITIPTQRVEELVVYMCDLEDWLEKEGLMK